MTARTAIVTGGGSGVGAAIALALAQEGYGLRLIGRRLHALQGVAGQAISKGVTAVCHAVDLANDAALRRLCAELSGQPAHVLVHSAGSLARAPIEKGSLADFDTQQHVNLRAPYALTQALLPSLKSGKGEVVFVNSSSGLTAKAGGSGYDSSKHGLRALADSLRQEVNADSVRVLSLYLGQTATAMQENLAAQLGNDYHPERLIQPTDVATAVLAMLRLPRTAEVTDLHIRPCWPDSLDRRR